jgi:hypothetical protein
MCVLRRQFLTAGEEVIYTEKLEKGRGLFSKQRQLLLTSLPRFIYVDADNMVQKGVCCVLIGIDLANQCFQCLGLQYHHHSVAAPYSFMDIAFFTDHQQ